MIFLFFIWFLSVADKESISTLMDWQDIYRSHHYFWYIVWVDSYLIQNISFFKQILESFIVNHVDEFNIPSRDFWVFFLFLPMKWNGYQFIILMMWHSINLMHIVQLCKHLKWCRLRVEMKILFEKKRFSFSFIIFTFESVNISEFLLSLFT